MHRPLKPLRGLFFILLGVTAFSLLMQATRPAEIVPWRDDYGKASEEARAAGKPLFVYFTASWCGPCRNLRHTTWAHKDVEAALRDCVPVKVDIDRHPDVASRHDVRAVPSFVVLRPGGVAVAAWDGASSPEQFVAELKRALSATGT